MCGPPILFGVLLCGACNEPCRTHPRAPPSRSPQVQYFSKLSSPAPRLQNLKLSTESDWSEWSLVLFNGDTPALRTLELSRCPLPWYSFKLGGLMILSLYRVPVRFQENMEEFLATLHCMQNLQHLCLDSALRSAAGIDLPRLSRLWVVAPLSTVITSLSCVHIPLKTEVRLRPCCEGTCSPDSYAPLLSFLAQRCPTIRHHFNRKSAQWLWNTLGADMEALNSVHQNMIAILPVAHQTLNGSVIFLSRSGSIRALGRRSIVIT